MWKIGRENDRETRDDYENSTEADEWVRHNLTRKFFPQDFRSNWPTSKMKFQSQKKLSSEIMRREFEKNNEKKRGKIKKKITNNVDEKKSRKFTLRM